MRVIDVRRIEPEHHFTEPDVCVIGAGAAGVYLAHRLAQQGWSVLLLEAGGVTCVDGATLGMGLELGNSSYRGATLGRAFGLGGTTSRWGGQLVPYSESNVNREDPVARQAWRHIVDTVERHGDRVRQELGVQWGDSAAGDDPFHEIKQTLADHHLTLLASDWLPFHQRNLSRVLRSSYAKSGRVEVLLHALAQLWAISPGPDGSSRVEGLTIRSNEREFKVRAPHFIIAAGTIESARILLEIQSTVSTNPFASQSRIGEGLTDHLSCPVADVPAGSRIDVIKAFGPRFTAGHMRSARLLESSPPPGSARGFFHFIFDIDNAGFHVARKVFAGLQSRRLPELSGSELLRGASGLVALGWDRVARSKLHVPAETAIHLQLDMEQLPSPDCRVRLGERRDAFGRRAAEIRWLVSDADREQAELATERFRSAWTTPENSLPKLEFKPSSLGEVKPHDAYHPVGVCRLGTDEQAVVDPNLRVRGTSNLWLLSTGVFPTAGTANPAFSMLCMGEHLVEHLTRAGSS